MEGKHIGYATADSLKGDLAIITLEITGICNEDRDGIYNKDYAEYEFSEAIILSIENTVTGKQLKKIKIIQEDESEKIFTVGEVIKDAFYFLTKEPAQSFGKSFLDSLRDGKMKSWYEDGSPHVDYEHKEGEPCGEFKQWYRQENGGHLKIHRFTKNYFDHGEYKEWYSKEKGGHLKIRCFYENGILNGSYRKWYPKLNGGDLEIHCFYQDGKLHGFCNEYYSKPKGQIVIGCVYRNGKENGVWSEYYSNGNKELQIYCSDGIQDGLYTEWWFNGNWKFICSIYKDETWGDCTEWWSNGNKKCKYFLSDGIIEGLYQEWYKNGITRIISHYNDEGELDHFTEWWMWSGKRVHRKYEDGERVHEERWDDNGKLVYDLLKGGILSRKRKREEGEEVEEESEEFAEQGLEEFSEQGLEELISQNENNIRLSSESTNT